MIITGTESVVAARTEEQHDAARTILLALTLEDREYTAEEVYEMCVAHGSAGAAPSFRIYELVVEGWRKLGYGFQETRRNMGGQPRLVFSKDDSD